MPIFEYRCADCGTRFEKLIRRESDAESLVCPSCGTKKLEKQLSTFAAHASSASAAPGSPPCGAACPTPNLCSRN